MTFGLTAAHLALRARLEPFARGLIPEIRQLDAAHRFAHRLVAQMATEGLLGICLPAALGGAGNDYVALTLAAEALEYADASLREVLAVHLGLHAMSIWQWGTPEQQQRWLPGLASGMRLGAFALNEREAGSDVANLSCSAVRDGDVYLLNGTKTWITLATVCQQLLVFAKLDPARPAISAFVIDSSTPGVTATRIDNKMGDWAGDTGTITFANARVPLDARLGEEGEGFKIAMSALDTGRLVVAAGAVGCMKACRDEALAHALKRKAFGKPLAEQQLVQQLLAQMQQRIDIGELLVLKAALLKNAGLRNTRESSMAKWVCAEAANQCANDAVQLLGSAGYSDDHDAARHLRNSKAGAIYQGTSQIHTLIQADYLTGARQDKPLRRALPPLGA